MNTGFAWDHTTWLNLVLLVSAAVLVWRFLTTGGPAMLKRVNHPGGHDHADNGSHSPAG